MRLTFFLFLLFITGVANATDYYVSASGNDSNNGTSQTTSWKSLSKVQNVSNAGTIQAGDRILFKCGDSFTGIMSISSIWGNNAKSGTAANPITLGSYGTGAKPVFLYPQGGSTPAENRILMYFVSVDYWVVDGLSFTDLNTTNNHVTPANLGVPLYLGSYGDGTCNHWTIKNVDITLCGMGVVIVGDYNTVTNCNMSNFKNLKSTPNVGGSSAYEDYGANPFTIIWANNNTISHNNVSGGWAESMDFGYNGGFCETIGACSNNKIMYNTIVDCNGLSEFGQGGNSVDNMYAYNKLVNCGAMFWVNPDCQLTNAQFFNNVVIENNDSRFAQGSTNAGAGVVDAEALSHLNVDVDMFAYSGQTGTTVFNLKNNILQVSNPLKIAKSSETRMAHDYNVTKLSGGSAFGPALNTHDKSTASVIFTNTAPADPVSWNLTPPAGSPPIDAGTNVGIPQDFIGNPVPTVPNAGILETVSGSSLTANSTAGAISCNGGTTTVTVTASGGTAPYTGTGTFTVSAGTYTYSVTDAAGTVKTTSITVSQPAAIAVTLSSGTIATYGGTTTVTVIAGGGTGTYTYKLNNGSYQSSNTFTGVAAGDHTITVKDVNGCTSVKTFTLTQPVASDPLVAASTAGIIGCNGGTATVTVSATGGVTPYSGTGTFTANAGAHTYTVTDAAGTTSTTSVTITQPTAITGTVSAGTIAVNGGTTTVTVSAAGGTPTYTYKLNSGSYQSSNSFTGVPAGDHTVTIKDKNGCTIVKTIKITEPGAPNPVVAASSAGTISCNGGTTTVTVSATGGTTPYTGTGTHTVSAGTYTYTVTDAAGGSSTTSITVAQPSAIAVSVAAGTVTGTGTTTATVTATGGTPGYTYSIDGGSYQSSNVFTGVDAGNHTVTVRDGRACTSLKSFTVSVTGASPLVISAVAGTISCNGGNTTVTMSATGGVAPYSGLGNFTVTAGTYTYTVTDAAGTTGTTTIVVTQPTAIVATLSAGTITTSGGTTTITVTATGGSGMYTYKLNSGSYQSSNTFAGVAVGTYTVTVKDAKGCTTTKSITITQTTGTGTFKLLLISKTNETCKGKKDGKIVVAGSGGTAPYTYRINFGPYTSNGTFTNLRPGFYVITGKSATGATATIYVVISGSKVNCRAGKSEEDNSTGLKTTAEGLKINAYPNPTTTEFSLVIEKGSQEDAHIFVTNVNGQPVYEAKAKSYDKISFGRNFVSGIYFIKVIQGNTVQNLKVIKVN